VTVKRLNASGGPCGRRSSLGTTDMKLTLIVGAVAGATMSATALAADAPPGATSCSGCHSPTASETATPPRLVGRDPEKIVAALQEFRSGQRKATIMDRIVKGFTPEEVQAIAAWYGAQK
jgi:cytochrome subunit of sulfide dehydrogenase